MMKKTGTFRFILSLCIILAITLSIFMIAIKNKVPANIFCFLDIGTYRIPPTFVEVSSVNAYGQSFLSNFDNLFMLSVFIPAQKMGSDRTLLFHLKNNPYEKDDIVLLEWKFSEVRFRENNFYIIPPDRENVKEGFHFHFQFAPIKNSKNKEFYFFFESPDATPGEGLKLGVWDNIDFYEALREGSMYKNHQPIKGFLAFRTYHTWQGSLNQLINQIKERLLKDKPFLIFYSLLIGIIFLGIILVQIKIALIKENKIF